MTRTFNRNSFISLGFYHVKAGGEKWQIEISRSLRSNKNNVEYIWLYKDRWQIEQPPTPEHCLKMIVVQMFLTLQKKWIALFQNIILGGQFQVIGPRSQQLRGGRYQQSGGVWNSKYFRAEIPRKSRRLILRLISSHHSMYRYVLAEVSITNKQNIYPFKRGSRIKQPLKKLAFPLKCGLVLIGYTIVFAVSLRTNSTKIIHINRNKPRPCLSPIIHWINSSSKFLPQLQ